MLGSLLLVLLWATITLTQHNHWNYTDPASWGGLCTFGKAQSPVNIDLGEFQEIELPPIKFHNYSARGTVHAWNNGHTELVMGFRSWTTQPSITGGGLEARYILTNFHFHWSDDVRLGSEHTINEARYPLELHFVHIREDLDETTASTVPGGIAVVAVLFAEAQDSHALFDLEEAFQGTGIVNQTADIQWYSPRTLLPKQDSSSFIRYQGSLTTPPCSEGVIWTVIMKPNHVTPAQLALLRQHFQDSHGLAINNWRPIQPLNGRQIYLARTEGTAWKIF